MARSKSQKMLVHKLKNGMNVDPRNQRGDFGVINGVTKSTPTLVEKMRRKENKYKGKNRYDREVSDRTYFNFENSLHRTQNMV